MTTDEQRDHALAHGWLEEAGADDAGPLYKLTQAGILRAAITQVIQGYHAGRGYGRSVDYLDAILKATEAEF